MTMPGTVHVGIVAFNSRGDLPGCLDSLRRQTYPYITLTILDNASQDGTAEWVRQHVPEARLLANQANEGFGRAHNAILARCRPGPDDYYMPLNPDVRLLPDYVAAVVDVLEHQAGGWGTGKLLDPSGAIYSAGHALCRDGYGINIGHGLADRGQFDACREVFGAPGAAPLYRARLIADLAPEGELFDRRLFMYGEDCDLDWRARRRGWRCWYTPHAVAYHRTNPASPLMQAHALSNRYLSVIKNAGWSDLLLYNLPLIALHSAARLALTPRLGMYLIARLIRWGPVMRRKRQPTILTRGEMRAWFAWSAHQPTGQPIHWRDRWRTFRKRTGQPDCIPTADRVAVHAP